MKKELDYRSAFRHGSYQVGSGQLLKISVAVDLQQINESGKKTGQTVWTLIPKRKRLKIKRFGRFICPYPVQSVHAPSNL